ncbi:hypothetical protein EYF80_026284 [Liparis tanakae]|uniref:Uncharacterized protein n=1 Tax=Liparis tanakae TaxID=230148 RepID=A0A4Z2HEU1_9TELE|nr:hypothetical protein EYF80_026284 [Liparis tanakae]
MRALHRDPELLLHPLTGSGTAAPPQLRPSGFSIVEDVTSSSKIRGVNLQRNEAVRHNNRNRNRHETIRKPRRPPPTSSAWPGRSMFSFPVLMSQTLSVLSLLPLTSSRLSDDHATWYTEPTWPRREAEASSLVSGEKSTWLTRALCPVILARGFLSSAGFHMNKVKSSEPDTKRSGAEPCGATTRVRVPTQEACGPEGISRDERRYLP